MSKIVTLIIAAVIVYVIQRIFYPSRNRQNDTHPERNTKPVTEIPNDKLILIKNARYKEIRNGVNDLCNLYNNEEYVAMPRLWKISENEFAITFPFDVEFDPFCWIVNYMHYQFDAEWNVEVLGWMTSTTKDTWSKTESTNKKLMIFVPEDDKEGDLVFFTTSDNIGYKFDFGKSEAEKLIMPKKRYVSPKVDLKSLEDKESEDFD